ncbi:GNAT family N-acetyltransferase [Couchioplanes caeruleus]|uniref:GNAT family N-acetyltransferase n=1 Tax=Couchioplanes caeruleus TaxID=56438 RepID=UPI0020C0A47D|nr:GNAT family N-acetyltransferase [Couchioplanes caeruleus]UQU63076.1 GNAT family N-acetyltransferase [Couchioplanes caeruleus]
MTAVSAHEAVTWTDAPFTDMPELAELAARCLAVDGGLPLASDPAFLRSRWTGDAVVALQARSPGGELVAAGALRPAPGDGEAWAHGAVFGGMVDPAHRSSGLGGRLVDWGLAEGRRLGGRVTVETESLTGTAERLFADRGLRQVFAEDVMRIDVADGVPERGWVEGTHLSEWSAETAGRFFRVYDAAFRDRPGFPGWSAEQWTAAVVDEDFRPGWSLLASVPGVGDAGFVTAAVGWIVQVGVVPAARGRGLGGALVCEALRRMRRDGEAEVWLDVNVDNPAVELYRRLGFEHRGRRARFAAW